ncbi:hypothetical protein T01_12369 [Trichinella spiralis]|uniref:Uncharacterized protein n=1 Tax=Trichinella spiralis TaxID=6334 RepID=A0A0V1BA61_TRISP|nr:hypothetical protein T01_12369 [Trichinella spiralis]
MHNRIGRLTYRVNSVMELGRCCCCVAQWHIQHAIFSENLYWWYKTTTNSPINILLRQFKRNETLAFDHFFQSITIKQPHAQEFLLGFFTTRTCCLIFLYKKSYFIQSEFNIHRFHNR